MSATPVSEPELLLTWRVHLARQRPVAAVVALSFIVAVAYLAQAAYDALWLTALGVLLMVGAAGEFLFPTRYRLTTAGAERWTWSGRQELAWDEVKVVYRFDDGLKLSTLARPGPLEAHRGLYLRWGDEAEAVRRVVDERATQRRRPAEDDDDRDRDSE